MTTPQALAAQVSSALQAVTAGSCGPASDAYAKAAAAGLVLAMVKQYELAFHPEDCADFTEAAQCQEIDDLLEAHPELDDLWREWMAAQQLAAWIAKGLRTDPAKAVNGLTAIASAIGIEQSHHDGAPLITADYLIGLAEIATGHEACHPPIGIGG